MSAPNVSDAMQTKYSENMITLLKEDLGGKAIAICEVIEDRAGKVVAYRMKPGSVTKGVGDVTSSSNLNLYTGNGDAGDLDGIEIPTKVISAGTNLSLEAVQTTSLDIKGGFLDSQKKVVARKADLAVMDAIRAAVTAGTITPVAHSGKKFSDDEVALDIISYVLEALDEVEESNDHRPDVTVFMNKADRRALYKNAKFLSSDFKEMINGSTFGRINKANIVGYKDTGLVTAGEAYIVPADTITFGKIVGTEIASIDWAPGTMSYMVTAGISAGAKVVEPESITVITTK